MSEQAATSTGFLLPALAAPTAAPAAAPATVPHPGHATFVTPGGALITIIAAHVVAVESMPQRQDALIHTTSGDTFTVGLSRLGALRDLGFLPAVDGE